MSSRRTWSGEDGPIYRYLGADGIVNLETANFSDASKWAQVGGNAGSIYIYMGESLAPGQTIDLTQTDFLDLGLWKEAPETQILLHDLNLSAAPSKAVAGLIVMNDVRGGSAATIMNATIGGSTAADATGDVVVLALESAQISAKVDSSVAASGGSSIDWDGDSKTGDADTDPATDHDGNETDDPAPDPDPTPDPTPDPDADGDGVEEGQDEAEPETPKDKVLALNGVIATNIVQSSAVASIVNSAVTSTGDVTVAAENVSAIIAETQAAAAKENGGDTFGITMAFNTIGWDAQNFLFNGIDAIIGDDTIADAFGGKNPAKTEAKIDQLGDRRR